MNLFEPISALAILLASQVKRFPLEQFCFPEQLAFIQDEAKFKTAVCSRRAGKTIACAADLISTALEFPESVSLYITLSRVNAKRLIWPELLKINREHALGGHPNEQELSLKFPSESVIYLSGAKHKAEIENFRGMALKKVYVDEAQSFRAYIQNLIDDVLSKALFDYNGTLCLTGTPGLVPAGYFYDCSKSSYWKHFKWTMHQNPHLERKSGKTVQELIAADCERMGIGLDHPKIQRECFGNWVVDSDSLVFKYDSARNHYESLPETKATWTYLLGVDLGFEDSDAIAVIGWSEKSPTCYLVEECITPKQGITELADQIARLVKRYAPMKIVMDTGGLGKKIAEEMRRRFSIPIQAAEKARKHEYIELLNDALRTGRFLARNDSTFAQDSMLIEYDLDKSKVDKRVISDRYHSDIADAVLYGYREALHWLYEPAPISPKYGTPEWVDAQEQELMQHAEAQASGKSDPFSDDFFNLSGWNV